MSQMAFITAVSEFTAFHVCAEAEPHEHTWKVEAAFLVPARTDARVYLAALDGLLAAWEWTRLPPEMEWNEDIARAVGTMNSCVRARVWRDHERIGAEWPVPEALR